MTRHRLNPVRLRAEILNRGLDGQTFAMEAGISAATLAHVVGGGARGTRTPDPLHAMQVLSQLSYGPGRDGSSGAGAA